MPKERSPALPLPSQEVLRFASFFGPASVFGLGSFFWGSSIFGDASGLRAGPAQTAQEQATEYAENRADYKSDS
jgi:hypothetical protein